ncbi:hypothetical protein HYPBUDRAFT_205051 [Hyphopichia burtonii NRRL Y-1933]|uniref:Uncharacterized protein n=1 Tax=Hyphopichia burtonii NRRL Y-1933 TaxID=984485 RepID=A0A1E4RIF0_9ASCO|nr:hypothetical protein HYPBUDRAFT_205051 [Hyphopichia burtonii NRRL Y-1933]ODV66875.1 hypothetical protein HYPBUDRAFT_205051 [Hyphopichia burtonii NRRL Y-1933]
MIGPFIGNGLLSAIYELKIFLSTRYRSSLLVRFYVFFSFVQWFFVMDFVLFFLYVLFESGVGHCEEEEKKIKSNK